MFSIAQGTLRRRLEWALRLMCLAVLTLGTANLRLSIPGLAPELYHHSLIALPVYVAIGLWLILGMPGLAEALSTHRRWWVVAVVLFALWIRLSTLWTSYPFAVGGAEVRMVLVAFFGLVTLGAKLTPAQMIVALSVGMVGQALVGTLQVVTQRSVGLTLIGELALNPQQAGVSIVAAGGERLLRAYGLTLHPNILGGYLAMALLGLAGWLIGTPRSTTRVVTGAILGVGALGLMGLGLSFSRGAWLGFGGGLLILVGWIVWQRAWRHMGWRRLGITVAVGIGIVALFAVSYGRFVLARGGAAPTELRSVAERDFFTTLAVQAFRDHTLGGLGFGTFYAYADAIIDAGPYAADLEGDHVHNVPLLIASETGLVGVALWVCVWGYGLWLARRHWRDPGAVGLWCALLALMLIGFFDHYPLRSMQMGLVSWGILGALVSRDAYFRTP